MAGFAQAIEKCGELLQSVEQGSMTKEQAGVEVSQLLSSMEEARGFFVALLTGTSDIADQPPDWLIDAFSARAEIVAELLAKNLAMSTATHLAHARKGDAAAATGSATVASRTHLIVERFDREPMHKALRGLGEAVDNRLSGDGTAGAAGDSPWDAFLARWSYDQEQLQAIKAALQSCK
jgi:hypothetical protein